MENKWVTMIIGAIIITFAMLVILVVFWGFSLFTVSTIDQIETKSSVNSSSEIFIGDSGSSLLLAFNPSTHSATSKNQTWLSFDGVNDWVTVADANSLDFNQTSILIWFKYIPTSNNSDVIRKFTSTGEQRSWDLIITSNSYLSFSKSKNGSGGGAISTVQSPTPINVTGWHFAGITYDLNNLYLYQDDNITGNTTSNTGIYYGTDSIKIGSPFSATQYYNGSIDHVIILNKSLTALMLHNLKILKTSNINYSINDTNLSSYFGTVYLVNSTLLYGMNNTAMYKSIDGGASFSNISGYAVPTSPWIFRDSRKSLFTSQGESTGNISKSIGGDYNWTYNTKLFVCQNASGEGYSYFRSYGMTEARDGSLLIAEYGPTENVTKGNCSYIHRSTNGGITWSVAYNATASGFPSRHMHMVQTDPYTGYIYASQSNDLTQVGSRLLRSIDNGVTWTTLYNGTWNAQPISVVFTPNYRIFGSDNQAGNTIVRTSDDVNFEVIYRPWYPTDGWFWSMSRDNRTGYIFAGTVSKDADKRNAVMLYSPDEGSNWYGVKEHQIIGNSYQGFSYITDFGSDGYAYYINSNTTKLFRFNYNTPLNVNSVDGIVMNLKLNENNGTIAYDNSGNGNNGTISGATWQNDGVNVVLTETTDYTLTQGNKFTLVNDDYSYGFINISYSFINSTSDFTTMKNNYADMGDDLTSKLSLVGIALGVILIVVLIILLLNYIRRDNYGV